MFRPVFNSNQNIRIFEWEIMNPGTGDSASVNVKPARTARSPYDPCKGDRCLPGVLLTCYGHQRTRWRPHRRPARAHDDRWRSLRRLSADASQATHDPLKDRGLEPIHSSAAGIGDHDPGHWLGSEGIGDHDPQGVGGSRSR